MRNRWRGEQGVKYCRHHFGPKPTRLPFSFHSRIFSELYVPFRNKVKYCQHHFGPKPTRLPFSISYKKGEKYTYSYHFNSTKILPSLSWPENNSAAFFSIAGFVQIYFYVLNKEKYCHYHFCLKPTLAAFSVISFHKTSLNISPNIHIN